MENTSSVLMADLQQICFNENIPWEKLRNQTVLITGTTGLIGGTLVRSLLWANQQRHLHITVIALVRNIKKAMEKFSKHGEIDASLLLVEGSVELLPEIPLPVDYVIHGANPTASAYFTQYPIETIHVSIKGTWNLLDFARRKNVKGFLYISSMEVYGSHETDDAIDEQGIAIIDTMSPRSCYPEAKRLCENLCAGYFSECGLPAKVIRLTQTFGPGVAADDNRVFAQFLRAALKRENIVLQTDGSTKRSYLYTADACSAILTVMLKGCSGEAYNAANPATYCSILDMAKMVAEKLTNNQIGVNIQIARQEHSIFPPNRKVNLQVDKLRALSWSPTYGLQEMFERTSKDWLERGINKSIL